MHNSTTRLGPWVRRFLLEHLVHERNLARNTQRSYRDTLALLAPFASDHARVSVDRLAVEHLSPDRVRQFLHAITVTRNCSPATCNQRLAAIRAFARFVGRHSPEHIEWSGHICDISFRKCAQAPVTYLEKPEIDALLAAPDRSTPQGRRDHAVLLFLYNTGARADEAAQLTVGDLELGNHGYASVKIRGKGNKIRHCPLWSRTVTELRALTRGRARTEHVFLNRCKHPLTRFGIHALVTRHVRRLSVQVPSLAAKRISPHTIRHTTATHLLRAGVDINTIRAWLGHVSLATTNIYAEVDLEMKAKALALCEVQEDKPARRWREDTGLMAFLHAL